MIVGHENTFGLRQFFDQGLRHGLIGEALEPIKVHVGFLGKDTQIETEIARDTLGFAISCFFCRQISRDERYHGSQTAEAKQRLHFAKPHFLENQPKHQIPWFFLRATHKLKPPRKTRTLKPIIT